MTSPPTAILYIAEDFEYMTQLKDTLHVKEVEIGKNKFYFLFLIIHISFIKLLHMLMMFLLFIDMVINLVVYQ